MTHFLAQISNPVLPTNLGGGANPSAKTGGTALGSLISSLIGALFIAAFFLAFMELLLGGVSWITAGGDKQKLELARDKITNSLVGLVIVGASYAIMSLVARFFGMDLTSLTVPSIGK